jgi:hypothetical protein
VKNRNPVELVVKFDSALVEGEICEQEYSLLVKFLPELLKEMIWQASHSEE